MRPFDNSIVPLSGTDILLTDYQVAKLTGRSRKTLQKDRVRGGGVPSSASGALSATASVTCRPG